MAMNPRSKTILAALLVIGVLLFVVVVLTDHFKNDPRYRLDPSDVTMLLPDDIVAADDVEASLAQSARRVEGRSIFDPDLVHEVRQAFEANPWVLRVSRVDRLYPSQVEVSLVLREALCAVEHAGRYLLADTQGVVLPGETDEPLLDPPHITFRAGFDADLDRRGLTDAWIVEAVREGAAVMQDLMRFRRSAIFDHFGVTAIDVSNVGGRLSTQESEVTLVTDRTWSDPDDGNRSRPVLIRWGRSTRHPLAGVEIPIRRKLRSLEDLLDEIPELRGLRSVDVRFDEVWYRPVREASETARGR